MSKMVLATGLAPRRGAETPRRAGHLVRDGLDLENEITILSYSECDEGLGPYLLKRNPLVLQTDHTQQHNSGPMVSCTSLGDDEICGGVVSLRSQVDRIQLWTRSKENVEKINSITRKMAKLLESEEVGEQDTMVLRVGNWAVGSSQGKEVGGDEFCALVHELVERVLTVRARGSPDDGLLNVALRYNVAHEGKERTYTGLVVHALATW